MKSSSIHIINSRDNGYTKTSLGEKIRPNNIKHYRWTCKKLKYYKVDTWLTYGLNLNIKCWILNVAFLAQKKKKSCKILVLLFEIKLLTKHKRSKCFHLVWTTTWPWPWACPLLTPIPQSFTIYINLYFSLIYTTLYYMLHLWTTT
jgi:hypothetical protein